MNVGVVGCGFVGFANAVLLASTETVYLFDIDYKKLDIIKHQKTPFSDKDIGSL